jgi:hypothetical protein
MLIDRMVRAAKLEVGLFEEVEADVNATSQAFQVVLIVALCSGIGSALGVVFAGGRGNPLGSLVIGIVTAILGWLLWSFLTYFVGTRVFSGVATWGEMLRTIGFAQSPGILLLVSFIPCLGQLLALAVAIWMLVAGVIAVRQALDVTTGIAVVTVVIGWLAYLVLAIVLGLVAGGASLLGSVI